jgi:NADH dehydrogenase [ubiquinone] 1 alpha subcomplex assembly factor 5
MAELFDLELRAMRRDRAARRGIAPFLYRRAFDDCIERLELFDRRFDRALLLGCLDPAAGAALAARVGSLEVRDPSGELANRAGGESLNEEAWAATPGTYDLILALGTLDTVNALPTVLRTMRLALRDDALLLGAISGGDTLPQLRRAMRAADAVEGAASPHVHPRIEAAALAPLLADAGFVRPVVDVDRVSVRYTGIGGLVADLRSMGATNVLVERPRRGLSRPALAAATAEFAAAGDGGRTTETIEILHFAAWTPAAPRA